MSDVTLMLSAIEAGDQSAAEKLLPLVYDELRKLAAQKMARESADHTLQATALVHEAYLRLVQGGESQPWNSRGHFFGAAAEAMRRILIDRARNKKRLKHGLDVPHINVSDIEIASDTPPDELLALDAALERLSAAYPECGQLVKLRFFAGLSLRDAAAALGMPPRTADRTWAFARAWLHRQLADDPAPATS